MKRKKARIGLNLGPLSNIREEEESGSKTMKNMTSKQKRVQNEISFTN